MPFDPLAIFAVFYWIGNQVIHAMSSLMSRLSIHDFSAPVLCIIIIIMLLMEEESIRAVTVGAFEYLPSV